MNPDTSRYATLRLLRGFDLAVGSIRVTAVTSVQRLLAFLALQERPVRRAFVAGALWPDAKAAKANANLRTVLWRTARTGDGLIHGHAQQIALATEVSVDIREAGSTAHRLLDESRPCDDLLTEATRAELSADLLPDWYDDDWVLTERERFRQLRLHALEALCVRLTAVGQYGAAVAAGLTAVQAEPLWESTHKALIEAHLAAGNRWEAIRQFHQCRQLLHDELGLGPSATLRQLLPEATTGSPPRVGRYGRAAAQTRRRLARARV